VPPTPSNPKPRRKPETPFDRRLLWLVLGSGAPAIATAMTLLCVDDFTTRTRWTLGVFVVGCWFFGALMVRERVVRPLQTIANLLAALREGDFSIRARRLPPDDPLGGVHAEINTLGTILREQRLVAMEATALLRTVMAEIDVAIFAFDESGQLRLINRSGQELLAQPAERVIGRSAAELGLAICLEGASTRVLPITFPGGQGRWAMRRTSFRERGLPHQLIVIADLTRALRDEELKAWQRLVRVLGHELNNSLAPIKSLAGSLTTMLERRPADWESDMAHGLEIIATRADGLARFMEAYARLARLPQPTLAPADLCALVRRAASLETRAPVHLADCPKLTLDIDAAQIEQLLINVLKNAAEAARETGGAVHVSWSTTPHEAEVRIEDDGPGIANPSNLFVPFFTTKPGGSGIGLVLCRQIAENHGGTFTLANRADRTGSVATIRLPQRRSPAAA
jgi:two-component system, NtrC family, nitrogen regulation sensor histidine kinase NtrY